MGFRSITSFPETHRSDLAPTEEDGPNYIPSSQGLGIGHCEGDHLAPFSNGEFPNTETGVGKNGTNEKTSF